MGNCLRSTPRTLKTVNVPRSETVCVKNPIKGTLEVPSQTPSPPSQTRSPSSPPSQTQEWPDPKTVDAVPFKSQKITAFVYNVYDGDTCSVMFPIGNTHQKLNIRVVGIDAPEVKIRGDVKNLDISKLEMRAGVFVRDKVKKLIENRECQVKFMKWDKYGGRVIGVVYLPSDTKYETLTEYLLSKRYAKPYFGSAKEEWTEEELYYILDH